MTDHLPECLHDDATYGLRGLCICDELRACEQRVREEERAGAPVAMIELAGYSRGYAAGVQAARNVVLAYVHPECLDEDNPQCDVCPELIDRADAIDALKEKP